MKYWWVNQNQTFTQEVGGGYLWSPKTRRNGARSYFYDAMTYVEPGDLVFSFKDTLIQAIGVIQGTGYESPKPEEFGTTGEYWSDFGWRVDVAYTVLPATDRIRPKDMMGQIAPLLPDKYSPLRHNGDGIQSVYLTEVPAPMAEVMLSAIGQLSLGIRDASLHLDPEVQRQKAEEAITRAIERSPIEETTRKALVAARVGQGRFRADVLVVEPRCRITGVEDQRLLIASHIRPWHRCPENEQRLDPFNGLMLTPTFDRMFDRGLLTFEDNGDVLVSPTVTTSVIHRIGLDAHRNVGRFNENQRTYLEYHRENIYQQIA